MGIQYTILKMASYDLLLFELKIAKRTKSKNRMQITEFPAGLGQRKPSFEGNTRNVGEVFVSQVFQKRRLLPLKKSLKSSTIPVCLSESCLESWRHSRASLLKPWPEDQTSCRSSFSGGIICGSGSFPLQFGGHFRSGDHLRSGIICGAVQIAFI